MLHSHWESHGLKMGIVRLLLALAVVHGHAVGVGIIAPYTPSFRYLPVDPVTAVQMFFVISGFYMGLVLSEKYRALDGWVWKFYLNRYTRLMPVYIVVVALTFWIVGSPFNGIENNSWQNIVFKFSTLTLFGIEFTAFYDITSNAIQPAHGHLPVPQAWSLGVELWFYLLAPLIIQQSTRKILAITVVILCLRVGISFAGHQHEFPWLQRIWILELYFFLLGILAYRAYAAFQVDQAPKERGYALALGCAVCFILFAGHVSGMEKWTPGNALTVTCVFAALLPMIFSLTKNSVLDRWIGEFSYPLYLVHILILNAWAETARSGFWAFAALSILASVPLVLLVEIPVDWWRQRFFRRQPRQDLKLADAG